MKLPAKLILEGFIWFEALTWNIKDWLQVDAEFGFVVEIWFETSKDQFLSIFNVLQFLERVQIVLKENNIWLPKEFTVFSIKAHN